MVWKVVIIESERDWGQRVEEVKEFPTKAEAEQFVEEYNKPNNLPYVPDWYMKALPPYETVN